jgi:hypothetical protein
MHLSSARLNTAQPVGKSDGLRLLREVTWKKITRTYVSSPHLIWFLSSPTGNLAAARRSAECKSHPPKIPREAAASHPHAGVECLAVSPRMMSNKQSFDVLTTQERSAKKPCRPHRDCRQQIDRRWMRLSLRLRLYPYLRDGEETSRFLSPPGLYHVGSSM